jgi:hypothetical protein
VPPVVNGLQIAEALDFQRFQRIQSVAWWLLALVPISAVLGLFGQGLFSETSAGGARAGVTATYDRFARHGVDTDLELALTGRRGSTVAISRAFLDRYSVTDIQPEPIRVTTRAGDVVFRFVAGRGGVATFTLQADAIGSSSGTVTAPGGRPIRIRQLVYP